MTCGIRRTAGLCGLSGVFRLVGAAWRVVVVRIIRGGRCQRPSESSQPIRDGAGWLAAPLSAARIGEESLSVHSTTECRGDSHGRGRCQGLPSSRVLAVLRDAGRAEGTVRRQQVVLDRFAAFLAGRGLDTASDRVCIDFIANQTGVRLGSLREPVNDRDVQAVRRPVVLMADVLAGRAVEVDRSVIPAKDGCPARFRPLRDDYLASCRGAATPRRPWSRRTRRPAGSWATWTRWASMISRRSACGTCRASCCANVDCDARPSRP